MLDTSEVPHMTCKWHNRLSRWNLKMIKLVHTLSSWNRCINMNTLRKLLFYLLIPCAAGKCIPLWLVLSALQSDICAEQQLSAAPFISPSAGSFCLIVLQALRMALVMSNWDMWGARLAKASLIAEIGHMGMCACGYQQEFDAFNMIRK